MTATSSLSDRSRRSRRHDIDALRVVLLGLLICHHLGSLYTGWDWFIGSSHRSNLVAQLLAPIHIWRMAMLFLISGLALSLLRRQTGIGRGDLLRNRSKRLLVPLAFGVVFIIPLQPYVQMVWHGHIEPGFPSFIERYFFGAAWPSDFYYGSPQRFATGQLWYLPYLWVYTAILVLFLPMMDSPLGTYLRSRVQRLRGVWLILIPAIPKLISLYFLEPSERDRAMLLNDWSWHLTFFCAFMFGFLISDEAAIWAEIRRLRTGALVLAIALWVLFRMFARLMPANVESEAHLTVLVSSAFIALDTWVWMLAAMGWASTLLDRPFKWLPYASEAIFPWYMLHQTMIVGLAYVLVPMKLDAWREASLIIVGTLFACHVLHHYVIRRTTFLRPLFGMKERRAVPRTAPRISVGSESPRPAGTSVD